MNDTEPIYLKRPILQADCLALARIARLSGDKTITPTWLQRITGKQNTQSLLYEHEIDGVAHPIAFCLWEKESKLRTICISAIVCHLEYDGYAFNKAMLSHVAKLVTPMYPYVLLEGAKSSNEELISSATALGFRYKSSSLVKSATYFSFIYGADV